MTKFGEWQHSQPGLLNGGAGWAMPDEIWIHTRLVSPLFVSLVHAVEMIGSIVHADVAAGRIFNGPPQAPAAYVNAGRLGLSQAGEQAVSHWPRSRGSVFELLRQHGPGLLPNGVFRPTQLIRTDGLTWSIKQLYEPITTFCPVVDALGVACELPNSAWCAMIFVRCGHNAPFQDEVLLSLRRLRPALTQAVLRGYEQQSSKTAPATTFSLNSAAELLTRLSRTERNVLRHLRSGITEREVAERLERSPHTIHVHVKNIYRKLNVRSRKELLALLEN